MLVYRFASSALFLSTSAILAAVALLPQALVAQNANSLQPNIILCMTDDQGWGDTGYNGHPVLRTPHLDQMAKDGICFTRFYSGAPVCSPTRGSCLTGRHPYRYGITNANVGHMTKEEFTLAEALKSLGYSTGHFGKWHLGTLTTQIKESNRGKPGDGSHYSPPWENGFDECFSTEAKVPTWWTENAYQTYGTHYWTGAGRMVPAAEISGDDSRLIMDRALPFIETAAKQETPFLAVIWFHAPHLPVVAAPPNTDGYTEHQDYYGCITAMDEQMGRLRGELKNLGIADNTMLWFCSDNGPEGDASSPGSTNGLRGRKRSLYEGGVRVPGLLVWPNVIKTGRVVSMPCSTSDYFPTVMDALGHQFPETEARLFDGVSLLPAISAEMNERPRPIAFESQEQVSLIDNRFKIYSNGKSWELYDLIADPNETTNVSDQHEEVVRSMIQTVEEWRQSCRESSNGISK